MTQIEASYVSLTRSTRTRVFSDISVWMTNFWETSDYYRHCPKLWIRKSARNISVVLSCLHLNTQETKRAIINITITLV